MLSRSIDFDVPNNHVTFQTAIDSALGSANPVDYIYTESLNEKGYNFKLY